jgi:hypothetical protein
VGDKRLSAMRCPVDDHKDDMHLEHSEDDVLAGPVLGRVWATAARKQTDDLRGGWVLGEHSSRVLGDSSPSPDSSYTELLTTV